MKSIRFALMPLLLVACSLHVSTGGGTAAGPRPAPAPAPRPAAPPPPPVALAAPPAAPAPAPGGGTRIASRASTRIRGISHVAPAPTPPPDVVNVMRIKSAAARNPKGCGLREMDTNLFVRVDCHDYQPIAAAVPHTSARKLKLLRSKQTSFRIKRRASSAPVATLDKAGAPKGTQMQLFEKDDAEGGEDVDIRAMGLDGPIKNQLSVGSCTAFSLSTAMDNAVMKIAQRTGGGAAKVVSPIDVWSEYGTPKMEVAWESVKGKPITDVDHWQYSGAQACKLVRNPLYDDCNEAYNVMPGTWQQDKTITQSMATAKQAGMVSLTRVEKYMTLPSDNDELIATLKSGYVVWAALKIDGSAWSNKQMKNGVIPDWTSPSGGHAIVISGVRKTPAGYQYLIHNSWGTSWGQDGRAWISEAMAKKFMHYAYKIHVDGEEDVTPPPAPTPGQPPGQPTPPPSAPQAFVFSDDECASDEVVDLAVGQCAKICADDTRPFGGQCGVFPSFGSGAPKK